MDELLKRAAIIGDLIGVSQYSAADWQPHRKTAIIYFARACGGGHLAAIRWLHNTFGLTFNDVLLNNTCALRWACATGHLTVCKWLHITYSLRESDVKSVNNFALRWACGCGHLQVAQWLHKTFSMTASDAKSDNNFALCWASEYGISAFFGEALLATGLTMSKTIGKGGHITTIQWLCTTFKLPWPNAGGVGSRKWTRFVHRQWYWQPHVASIAPSVSRSLLMDILQRLI